MPSSVHPCEWSNTNCIPDNYAYDMECYPGTLYERYEIYRYSTNSDSGDDVANKGRTIKSFEEWLES